MRFAAVAALQLFETFSHFSDSANLPPEHLASRDQSRQTLQAFEEDTARFNEQGLCRQYIASTGKQETQLDTCEPKCGNLLHVASNAGNASIVNCIVENHGTPGKIDPDGDRYNYGKCVCQVPVKDHLVDGVNMSLPVVADIGCPILYGAFDIILLLDQPASMREESSKDVGMEAAAQAAKAMVKAGKTPNAFSNWFNPPCDNPKYLDNVAQIFEKLDTKSGFYSPQNDTKAANTKEQRSPKKGKSGGGGKGSKSSSNSGTSNGSGSAATKPKPPDRPPKKAPDKKKNKPSKASKKPESTKSKSSNKITQSATATKSAASIVRASSPVGSQRTSTTASSATPTRPSQSLSQPETTTVVPTSTRRLKTDGPSTVSTSSLEDGILPGSSTNGPDLREATVSSDLQDATPKTSIRDSPLSAQQSDQSSLDTSGQPSESLEDTPSTTGQEPRVTTPAVTPEPSIDSSSGTDGTPSPTKSASSTAPRKSFSAPPVATLTCPSRTKADPTAVDGRGLVKRTDAPVGGEVNQLHMALVPDLGGTYVGFVPLEREPGCREFGLFAQRGYEQIVPGINYGTIIVATLWIPDVGVVVASKARPPPGLTRGFEEDKEKNAIAKRLVQKAALWFPDYYELVEYRTHLGPTDLDNWHAEDVALCYGAKYWTDIMEKRYHATQKPPANFGEWEALATAYGKYNKDDVVGFKPACGSRSDEKVRITPPCAEVLADLKIRFVRI
ncbi:MAG: hypothetical protein Q9222_001623 [Ikaeria aurantiellina]